MSVAATGIIGLPTGADSYRRLQFDTYDRRANKIEMSRFATFELAITKPSDESLDIQQ